MNIDENVRKILAALLRKWKVIVIFAIVGVLVGYFYTANFTTLTYTSTVEFLAYAVDKNDDLQDTQSGSSNNTGSEQNRISNTSRMNYAMKMLPTYIEIFGTNDFDSKVVAELNDRTNASYTSTTIKSAIKVENIEDTAMFKATVTTTSADLSYEIAHQLETTIPEVMKATNNGLVNAEVQDKPIKASAAGSLGYPKKCAIGAVIGIVIAAAYIILRNLLDVRIRGSEELIEKYNIPVLGSIPSFEIKSGGQRHAVADSAGEDKDASEKPAIEELEPPAGKIQKGDE